MTVSKNIVFETLTMISAISPLLSSKVAFHSSGLISVFASSISSSASVPLATTGLSPVEQRELLNSNFSKKQTRK